MEENKVMDEVTTYVDNGDGKGFLPVTGEDAELAFSEGDDSSINPIVVGGAVAAIAGAGFGLYKLGKWIGSKVGTKMEESRIKKLEKRGYIVIPQREPVEDDDFIEEAPEEAFEEEEPQKKPSKKKKAPETEN